MNEPRLRRSTRRGFLSRLPVLAGAGAVSLSALLAGRAQAAEAAAASERFPGDPPEHKIVYQFNQADYEYQHGILNSVSAMLQKYGDNVGVAVVCWGPGIHVLARAPKREVHEEIKLRIPSLHEYGVRFIACGNTMNTVGWTKADMLDFAEVEEVGAAAVMELQEQGYKYLAW